MREAIEVDNEITNGKNERNVRCSFCNSLMLKSQQGLYEKIQVLINFIFSIKIYLHYLFLV